MMRKMKKVLKRALGSMVVVALLVSNVSFVSLAAEFATAEGASTETSLVNDGPDIEILDAQIVESEEGDSDIVPYTMLTRCQISVSRESGGMRIEITTGCVGTASVIGVKDVKIQKKTWYGGWDTVATCSGAELQDRTSIAVSILYENAVEGATYKITCVHYADVDGYIESDNDSGSFKYNF